MMCTVTAVIEIIILAAQAVESLWSGPLGDAVRKMFE